MEIDGSGDESAAAAGPGRGKKRPPSPSTPPSDGEHSSKSTTSDEDDGGWAVSDSGTDDEEEDEHQGKYPPFTIDDFPRVSSDHFEQADALYEIPDIHRRGPLPISLFRAFKDPLVEKNRHWFGTLYKLYDESEININNNVGTIDCSDGCHCRPMNLLQFIDLKIAGYRHAQPGCAKIFGFFAARDQMEPLRNYVYRREVDNYEALNVKRKMEATVVVLRAPANGLNLNLYAKTSGFRDAVRLFRGVAESGCRMSSVVAVTRRSYLKLCIEGSPKDDDFSRNMWER